MAKKLLALLTALLLMVPPALGDMTVERMEGEQYFPSEKDWSYHFTYAYPHVVGDDYATAAVNDAYLMALDEMTQLVLPMFAHEETMRFDGKNQVDHDFLVVCNDGKLLSILQLKRQTQGEAQPLLTAEALTFDMTGVYAGEPLTLRGVTLAAAGIDPEELDDVTAEDAPRVARIIDGSSDLMEYALRPYLYQCFADMQRQGKADPRVQESDFNLAFSPAAEFYPDGEGRLVFFFPPELMADPSFDLLTVTMTPEEIDALL